MDISDTVLSGLFFITEKESGGKKRMKRRKGEIHFQARKHSVPGILSLMIGILAIAALAVVAWISGLNRGESGISAGIAGVVIFMVSACGFATALYSFKEKDIYYTASVLGVLLNGALFAVCLGLYMIGVSI